jgi:tRNA modification GTPase
VADREGARPRGATEEVGAVNSVLDADTIAAVATAPGRGAVAVVRLSGPGAHEIGQRILRRWPKATRRATVSDVTDPATGALVDRVVATSYAAPASYTGEPMLELSGHGGPLAPAAVLALVVRCGARPAEPGEFTRRAVLNGKLDVLQAEGVADVVDAPTEAARRAALLQADGGLSRRIESLRSRLLDLEAMLAYEVDFPEEDDGPIAPARIATGLQQVMDDLRNLLATARIGDALQRGASVAIVGLPNAGKSSLFNALLGRRRAIVSELPGTTRDAIEALLEGSRWPLRLVDTAGLRESADAIERTGLEIGGEFLAGSDVALVCGDDAASLEQSLSRVGALTRATLIPVRTKCDHTPEAPRTAGSTRIVRTSSVTGEGLGELVARIESELDQRIGTVTPGLPVVVRARHQAALEAAESELAEFASAWGAGEMPAVLAAVHLRAAVHALESLIGVVDVEDVLARIFSSFCIGK